MANQYERRFSSVWGNFQDKIDRLSDKLNRGSLSEFEWRNAMRKTIADSYTQAYRLGASAANGSAYRLTGLDRQMIDAEVNQEYAFLGNFYQDLRDGDLSAEYISWRSGMYGDALSTVYWAGQASQFDDTLYEAWFLTSDDEKVCDGCQSAADGSPYTPSDCPLPGADVCEGFTNCRCTIDFRDASPEYLADNFPDNFEDYLASPRASTTKRAIRYMTLRQMRTLARA